MLVQWLYSRFVPLRYGPRVLRWKIPPNSRHHAAICSRQNASAVTLGSGAHPYWASKSDGWYLFYSSTSAKAKFGNNKSYLRKLNASSLAWAASAVEVTYDGKSSFMKG